MTEEKPKRVSKVLEEIMGQIPQLEIGRKYRIDFYPFGRAIRSGYKVESSPPGPVAGSGEVIEAQYIGHVDEGTYYNKHVFVFEDENGEANYAFFNVHETREINGVITYPSISSDMTECFTRKYFTEELPRKLKKNNFSTRHIWESRLKLLKILRQLGEEI